MIPDGTRLHCWKARFQGVTWQRLKWEKAGNSFIKNYQIISMRKQKDKLLVLYNFYKAIV